ncbi:hypothetical protein Y1Q_0011736 [Alligator mississippiensis]|uniref:Uncharacterized protein n=1 Tax=Alligator mississippiensis TaxID=8496 RepID=A0A151M0X8_ALLMI|nr:hypothetical protein Y1Q_0011736 [Alligator mississippiensis]
MKHQPHSQSIAEPSRRTPTRLAPGHPKEQHCHRPQASLVPGAPEPLGLAASPRVAGLATRSVGEYE